MINKNRGKMADYFMQPRNVNGYRIIVEVPVTAYSLGDSDSYLRYRPRSGVGIIAMVKDGDFPAAEELLCKLIVDYYMFLAGKSDSELNEIHRASKAELAGIIVACE